MSQVGRRKAEIRGKAVEGLREELDELYREHFNLRVQKAAQQNTKSSELRRVRRNTARVKTILREKEMSV